MSETFRPGTADEVSAAAGLMMHSFPNPARSRAWWEDVVRAGPLGGHEALWVGEEEGRLVAACMLFRLRQWIGGTPLPVMGLGAVAIAPTHRRRGMAGRMVEAGFRHALERGDVASALYPFRVSFYAGLGYGLAGQAIQYQLPPTAFPDDREARRRMHLVATDEDVAALREVYARGAPTQTGQVERDERSWRSVWGAEDVAGVLYRGPDGRAEGYALVRYRADLPPDARYLEVEERMWLTPGARRGIYAWLGSLGDQWREVLYRAHPEERFEEVIAEPRLPLLASPGWRIWFPAATLLRGPMFRLLDVPRALGMRSARPGPPLILRLEVEDAQLPENRGPWRLDVAGERMEATPHRGGPEDASLRLRVETLSRIYAGDLSPSAAVEVGRAAVDRPEVLPALDEAFRVPRPWTFDRF